MDKTASYYDVSIVGGGLAGLASAIQLTKCGYRVILFEKENYPFHKVCGEYISLESWDFLQSLGLPLARMHLPRISTLSLSSPNGTLLTQRLPLGGFGISRYTIDYALVNIAKGLGVNICDGTKVTDIEYAAGNFTVTADSMVVRSKVCCGAFGKRSNLDLKWKRDFVQRRPNALNHFIGVKYHAVLDHPPDTIALHYFRDGYCGISPLEDNKTCICYLTSAHNLRSYGGNIAAMEENVLYKNAFLNRAFASAQFLYDRPLTISQISFDQKEQVRNHILLIGDAAGLITPLCGNGMSMALLGSEIASAAIVRYLEGRISRAQMEAVYSGQWRKAFARRLRAGRIIQSAFGRSWLTNTAVSVLRHFPFLVKQVIRQTHGH